MNRLSVLALSAALALSVPLIASAQDAVDASAAMDAGNADDADAGANDDAGSGAFTYDDLNAALQSMAEADLSAVTPDTEIEIVPLSSLQEEATETADEYTVSVPGDQADISEMQAAIAANSHISAALEEAGHTAEDVAALWVQGDGSLTIFIDDSDVDAAGTDAEAGKTEPAAEGQTAPEAPADDATEDTSADQ